MFDHLIPFAGYGLLSLLTLICVIAMVLIFAGKSWFIEANRAYNTNYGVQAMIIIVFVLLTPMFYLVAGTFAMKAFSFVQLPIAALVEYGGKPPVILLGYSIATLERLTYILFLCVITAMIFSEGIEQVVERNVVSDLMEFIAACVFIVLMVMFVIALSMLCYGLTLTFIA